MSACFSCGNDHGGGHDLAVQLSDLQAKYDAALAVIEEARGQFANRSFEGNVLPWIADWADDTSAILSRVIPKGGGGVSTPKAESKSDFERQYDRMRSLQDNGPIKVGTGFPGTGLLEAWGQQLYAAFGEMPYLTGTAFHGKEWRDVDVRMMLDDDEWRTLIGTDPDDKTYQRGARWNALCISISLWGQRVTGLPIDFQFQPWGITIEREGGKARNPIGLKWDV